MKKRKQCKSRKRHNVYGGNVCRCSKVTGHAGPHECAVCRSTWERGDR